MYIIVVISTFLSGILYILIWNWIISYYQKKKKLNQLRNENLFINLIICSFLISLIIIALILILVIGDGLLFIVFVASIPFTGISIYAIDSLKRKKFDKEKIDNNLEGDKKTI